MKIFSMFTKATKTLRSEKTGDERNGLVLGSGAAGGLAHIGVIEAIRERNIDIDCIAGSSIGALVGACFARSGSVEDIRKLVLKTDWKSLIDLADLNWALLFKGFLRGDKVKSLLETLLGDIEFKDLNIPLSVVATDIRKGEEVVINEGRVSDAVRASISIPAIFAPVKLNGTFLVDGGIVCPLPVAEGLALGAERIIASNVIQEPKKRKAFADEKEKSGKKRIKKGKRLSVWKEKMREIVDSSDELPGDIRELMSKMREDLPSVRNMVDEELLGAPNIFDVILRSIYSMEYEVLKNQGAEADIVIVPQVGNIASLEFFRAEEAIRAGYEEAMRILNKV